MKASLGSLEVALAALAVGAGVYVLWSKGGAAVAEIKNGALNPANSGNVVNQVATAAVNAAAGGPDQTIGGRIWEFTHRAEVARENALLLPVMQSSSAPLLFGNELERLSSAGRAGRIYPSQSAADAEADAPYDWSGVGIVGGP